MIGKEVVIVDESNFYCDIYGKVIAEYTITAKVRFELNDGRHEVMFFKDQVELV